LFFLALALPDVLPSHQFQNWKVQDTIIILQEEINKSHPPSSGFNPLFSIRVYVHELAVTGNDLPPPRLETACQTLQGGHFFHVQQALKLARLDMDLFKRPFCSEAIGCSPTNLAAFR
jgi:hypothetical protein